MFAKKHAGLVAAAAALAFTVLASAAARAEDEAFNPYGVWSGSYESAAGRRDGSRITIKAPKRSSTATSLGDWDGFEILNPTWTKTGGAWNHKTKDKLYLVDAAWGGTYLHVTYKVYPVDAEGPNFARSIGSGEGYFTKNP